ncbi:GTP cyclohydrolase I FolE2 [Saccharothrix variisporea]|uniref:GTP cyclohydrolase I n=1 Tax=Saccharothrix variisporea TaxID=543527 RepID=A0A495XBD7_9PSEU|nr:GTP cyclohydrolase, FolE2/MptA family [Saccharothrix variisporea]RKT70425.1 GTP cyclohydrolase I [Saccharothrix variisporea]
MHDIQGEYDPRGVEVDEVGIAGLRYPVLFQDGTISERGVAEISVTVRLQADRRGTHMSRMVALVHERLQVFEPRDFAQTLKAGAAELDAPAISVTLSMPVAMVTSAPTSKLESMSVHDISVSGTWQDGECRMTTSVTSEVTSLCPCSKSISDYGAHNQRSKVTLSITGDEDDLYPLNVADAVEIIAGSGSAPVVPLVKRVDERTLTMQAYDHPVFVEDMAREISVACRSRGLVHRVHVRNLESIHSHDAVALVVG